MSRYGDALHEAAEDACGYAYENASYMLKTLKGGRMCFYPVADEEDGVVGVGLNTEYHYLVYQNNGFASFPMTWAIGRVVPMMINGELQYRYCRSVGYEQPWMQPNHKNYWQRDADGELIPEFGPKLGWVHPGLPRKGFIDEAVECAIEEHADRIEQARLQDDLGTFGGAIVGGLKSLASRMRRMFR